MNHLKLLDFCRNGDIAAVEDLIASGVNIEISGSDGRTALHIASKNGRLEIVKLLIASGALLDKADNHGRTPLCIASRHDQ